jgi:hypothetical protein
MAEFSADFLARTRRLYVCRSVFSHPLELTTYSRLRNGNVCTSDVKNSSWTTKYEAQLLNRSKGIKSTTDVVIVTVVYTTIYSNNMGKKDRKNRNNGSSGSGGGRSVFGRNDDNDVDNEPLEERFRAAETRPQFQPVKKQASKVVLDDRFASVLTDPRFQLQEKDRYGRKKKSKKDAKDELSAFYTVENNSDEEDDNDDKAVKKGNSKHKPDDDKNSAASDDSSDGSDEGDEKNKKNKEDDNDEDPASRIAYLTAFSRGEIEMTSSSEDDDDDDSSDDDDDDDDEEDPVFGTSGVLDPSNKEEPLMDTTQEPTPYLVVMNMDWEHIRAIDLFSIIASFTPPGAVKRVQVYQSNYGMERMAKERLNGPTGLWKKPKGSKKGRQPQKDVDSSDDGNSDEDNQSSVDGSEEMEDEDEKNMEKWRKQIQQENTNLTETDFDPEKLRAYEASKLKYYFAIVQFATPEHADIAYREVDGLEFEHSSAALDLRSLPVGELDGVVKDRPMRDKATSVPGNYVPPEFVVSALQQTKVQCTWDLGDRDRERMLTKYAAGGAEWGKDIEEEDLKAYLASDASSDDEGEDDSDAEQQRHKGKGSKMRKLLGLDSDEEDGSGDEGRPPPGSDASESSDESEDGIGRGGDKGEHDMEVRYIPGKKDLEEKIRSKIRSKKEGGDVEELTPWQKYQEKRKEKRRERRQASRTKPHGATDAEDSDDAASDGSHDEFFANDSDEQDDGIPKTKERHGSQNKKTGKATDDEKANAERSKKELELLFTGEDAEEQMRDYDIRGIQRMEKNKDKKLRGSRKRKEDKLASNVSGTDFKVNTRDDRFSAVLDGTDDRFGIDKTDASYKDTTAMREILAEQTQRRKKKRPKTSQSPVTKAVPADVSAEAGNTSKSAGSSALSALVQRLKTKVSKAQ